MFTEMLLVGGVTIGLSYYRSTMDKRLCKAYATKWLYLMKSLNLINHLGDTFNPVKVNIIDSLIIFTIKIPAGFTLTKLLTIQEAIDSYFEGVSIIEKIKFSDCCIVKVITKNISDYNFEPIKCSDSELYIGKTLDNKNYTIDLNKGAAHLLIGAPSGKGKSFLLASILTNLIYNSSDKIDLYLLQTKKSDVKIFESCKPTKYLASSLIDVETALKELVRISDERDALFSKLAVKSISHYNLHYPDSTLNRIYVITEEISFFMPNDTDDEETKITKASCLESLKTLVKVGRSSGIHIISLCQRSTIENIPSLMKSMMIRISLGQISAIDSKNIIESDSAIYLDDKECLTYGYEPGEKVIHIPTIDEDFNILQKYVKEIKTHSTIGTNPIECCIIRENNNITEKRETNAVTEKIKTKENPNSKILDKNSIDKLKSSNDKKDKKILYRKGIYVADEREVYKEC